MPEKEDFYSSLNMEDIKGLDYNNFKKICKNFETKNLEEYHDLCLKSDTLLLADTFENFWKMCSEIYELDPAKFVSAPGLEWQASLKKTKVELELLMEIDVIIGWKSN